MSHASKLLLLSWLACAFACTVPTIDELEAERPAGCNTDHKCPSDSVCFENRCIRTADLGCIPGTRVVCGTEEGMCVQGSRLCGADGTYGGCEGEVSPAVEVCDGQDNDCDGTTDRWALLQLSSNHDFGASVAAIAVDRSSVSKPHTLLVVTVEGGSLLLRTRTADGVVSSTEKFTPPGPDISYQSPTLVADGDTVALAWVERTQVIGSGKPASHQVYVAMLNGEGKRTSTPPLRIPYGSTQPELKNLTIAMNRAAILVLVTTVGPPDTSSPGPKHELWAVTVARSLQANTLSLPNPLANPRDNFGPHATVTGTSDQFLVTYDEMGVRKVNTVSSGGAPGLSPVSLVALDEFTHSPFLSPVEGSKSNFILYYVKNNGGLDARTSDFSSVSYTDGTVQLPARLETHPERIERMRMAARPGVRKPALALWATKEPISGKRFLYLVALSPAGLVAQVKSRPVLPDPDFGEELVLMPDDSRYLFFHHSTALLAPPVSVTSEVYVQPFCGL